MVQHSNSNCSLDFSESKRGQGGKAVLDISMITLSELISDFGVLVYFTDKIGQGCRVRGRLRSPATSSATPDVSPERRLLMRLEPPCALL